MQHRDVLPDSVAALLPRDPHAVAAALESVLDGPPPSRETNQWTPTTDRPAAPPAST